MKLLKFRLSTYIFILLIRLRFRSTNLHPQICVLLSRSYLSIYISTTKPPPMMPPKMSPTTVIDDSVLSQICNEDFPPPPPSYTSFQFPPEIQADDLQLTPTDLAVNHIKREHIVSD